MPMGAVNPGLAIIIYRELVVGLLINLILPHSYFFSFGTCRTTVAKIRRTCIVYP